MRCLALALLLLALCAPMGAAGPGAPSLPDASTAPAAGVPRVEVGVGVHGDGSARAEAGLPGAAGPTFAAPAGAEGAPHLGGPLPSLAMPPGASMPTLPAIPAGPATIRIPLSPVPAAPPVGSPADVWTTVSGGEPQTTTAASASAAPGTPAATVAVGGLALLWLAFEKLGLARALVALYFRVQPGELLEHERRERVITLIRERPGIGPTDIAEDLGTGWGVTSYHLDRLERAGLVASQRVGHHRCYFLPGAIPRDQQRTVALFRGETTRRVAELVAKCPGIAQSQLCRQLGLSASAASKQVSRLEATGLIRRATEAGSLRLFPTAALTVVS